MGLFNLRGKTIPEKRLIFGSGMIKLVVAFDQTFRTGTGRSRKIELRSWERELFLSLHLGEHDGGGSDLT